MLTSDSKFRTKILLFRIIPDKMFAKFVEFFSLISATCLNITAAIVKIELICTPFDYISTNITCDLTSNKSLLENKEEVGIF